MPELCSNPLKNSGRDTRLPLGTFYPQDHRGGRGGRLPQGSRLGSREAGAWGDCSPLANRPQAEAARRVPVGALRPSLGRGLSAAGRTQAPLSPRGGGPRRQGRERSAGRWPRAPAAAAGGGTLPRLGGVSDLQRSAGSQWALPLPRKHSTVTEHGRCFCESYVCVFGKQNLIHQGRTDLAKRKIKRT